MGSASMAVAQTTRFVRPESLRYRPLSEDEYSMLRRSVSAVWISVTRRCVTRSRHRT